jgi:hypothetical protein
MQENFKKKLFFCWHLEGQWMMKIEGSLSQRHGSADPDPDPHQNVMDPQHWWKVNIIWKKQTSPLPEQIRQKSLPKQLAWCFLSTNSKWSYLLLWWLEWWWLARAECACAALWWCWGGSVCGWAFKSVGLSFRTLSSCITFISVVHPHPDPPDPHVFGPPGSGSESTSQRNGSGSGSGSFYHQAKIVRKTLIPTILDILSLKNDVNVRYLQKSNNQKQFLKN